MFKLLVGTAVLWCFGLACLLVLAAHHVAAHWFAFAWMTAVAVALPIAWRWFAAYRATAEIALRIDAAEGRLWKIVLLHVEGAKSAVLMVIASGLATAQDWVGTTLHSVFGLQPSDLEPLKDSGLLHTFFADGMVTKIIAGISLFGAVLSIKGKLTAARIVPAPGSPPAA